VIGSPVIAAWIAHLVFWGLFGWGWAIGAIEVTGRAVFLGLWLAGYVAFTRLGYGGLFSSFVAVLDIALVLIIFEGDLRIS